MMFLSIDMLQNVFLLIDLLMLNHDYVLRIYVIGPLLNSLLIYYWNTSVVYIEYYIHFHIYG